MLYGKQHGHCAGCDVHFPYRNLTIDHIIPTSKSGADIDENKQLLCVLQFHEGKQDDDNRTKGKTDQNRNHILIPLDNVTEPNQAPNKPILRRSIFHITKMQQNLKKRKKDEF